MKFNTLFSQSKYLSKFGKKLSEINEMDKPEVRCTCSCCELEYQRREMLKNNVVTFLVVCGLIRMFRTISKFTQ